MLRFCLVLAIFALFACKETKSEKEVVEKAVDSYGALIEKAKGTEAILQKKADSIVKEQESLGVPQ